MSAFIATHQVRREWGAELIIAARIFWLIAGVVD
jgi:hypothetical protein